MPELPEVETVKRGLEKTILGKKIKHINVLEPKSFQSTVPNPTSVITEQKISSISRKGKVLLIFLGSKYVLYIHLRMTGQIIVRAPNSVVFTGGHPTSSMQPNSRLPDSSTRVVFIFDDGTEMFFNDQRKFGYIKLLPTAELNDESFLNRLGPEPMDKLFTSEYLYSKLKSRKAAIKPVLLDQSVVAGLGNIYVDESLFLAGINPTKSAQSLSKSEVDKLVSSIKKVIQDAIASGGTSFSDYVNIFGTKGDYLQRAWVFGRQGENCKICGNTIIKIKLAGRGTHYCPVCQKD